MDKWDARFLELAKHVASWSKDPSTQTGAVIVRPDRTIASVGFNGFPRGCSDAAELYADRATKYARIVHCEMNAVMAARETVRGYTLYTWPFMSCERCAAHMVQAGIVRCVAPPCPPEQAERWKDSLAMASAIFAEDGVILELINA